MVLIMCEHLDLRINQKVLEVGAGSGYHAAVCAEIVAPTNVKSEGIVYTMERIEKLARFAERNLKAAGYSDRVKVIVGDGSLGYEEKAPYDRILVTAAAPKVPQPLINQLKNGGKLLIPVGGAWGQRLVAVIKKGKEIIKEDLGGCVFVPLIGKEGYPER